jgi:3-hydroxyisobutyrate dehydrogenase
MFLGLRQTFSFANVGFVGLGNMGFPMAVNLVNKGHKVYCFDVDASKSKVAEEKGMVFRKDLKDISREADIFVLSLPNTQHSVEVCESADGMGKVYCRFVQNGKEKFLDHRL